MDHGLTPPKLMRSECVYTAYYCEENVWWLNRHTLLAPLERAALVITNPNATVALAYQQAGGEAGVVIWDYHVVLMVRGESWWTYDLDCKLGMPVNAADWLHATFKTFESIPPRFQPQFRMIPGRIYDEYFASDRRHMRRPNGAWAQPPPNWAPIGDGHRLEDFISSQPTIHGPLLHLEDLLGQLHIKHLNH